MDGVEFLSESVAAVPIREEHEYDGIRVTLVGLLHKAHIPLQIDIGFGDAVTPAPEKIEFPTILDAPAPKLMAYSRYTMVAEKLETMVRLGVVNSRMKDFYDVWLLCRLFEFDGRTLCDAIRKTFKRRSTPIPGGLPMAFTDEFRKNANKQTQWRAFVRKAKPENVSRDIDSVIGDVAAFLMPVVEGARGKVPFELKWARGGQWGETNQVLTDKT